MTSLYSRGAVVGRLIKNKIMWIGLVLLSVFECSVKPCRIKDMFLQGYSFKHHIEYCPQGNVDARFHLETPGHVSPISDPVFSGGLCGLGEKIHRE